jgi:5-formyltetrahydrofolate cyclo-ligase
MVAPAEKDTLRQQARSLRWALHRKQGDQQAAVSRNFLAKFNIDAPDVSQPLKTEAPPTIAGYWPTGSEISDIDLLGRLTDQNWRVLLPIIEAADQPLKFAPWQPGDALVADRHGIMAPISAKTLTTPDIVLVPLLAYDTTGHRLGQGGGYYDRTLASLRKQADIVAVGLAYDGQQLDNLPRQDHDEPLDLVITETQILEFRRDAA